MADPLSTIPILVVVGEGFSRFLTGANWVGYYTERLRLQLATVFERGHAEGFRRSL